MTWRPLAALGASGPTGYSPAIEELAQSAEAHPPRRRRTAFRAGRPARRGVGRGRRPSRLRALACALALPFALAPAAAAAETLRVTSEADAGPGSLREALARAAEEPAIDAVALEPGLRIAVTSGPLEHVSSGPLRVEGAGATLTAEGDFDLLRAAGGGALTLRNLVLDGGPRRGVVLEVPPHATVAASLTLEDVVVKGMGRFGVHVDDAAGAPVGVRLRVVRSRIEANGTPAAPGAPRDDEDGIRVDERGPGSIEATFEASRIVGNAYDGVELDEAGPGDVRAVMRETVFEDNGGGSRGPEADRDVEDGFDVDEAGPGDVFVRALGSAARGSPDAGFDLDEDGPGSLHVVLREVEARGNGDHGVTVHERGPGDAAVHAATAALSENDKDGLHVDEEEAGLLFVAVRDLAAHADEEALQLEERGAGSLVVRVDGGTLTASREDGLVLREEADGDLVAHLLETRIADAAGAALRARQGGEGRGLLLERGFVAEGNGAHAPELEGVDRIPAAEPTTASVPAAGREGPATSDAGP